MTKKHFIALADAMRRSRPEGNDNEYMRTAIRQWEQDVRHVGNFCLGQSPNFNYDRWIGYIEGKCGKNSGKPKKYATLTKDSIVDDGDEYLENGKWHPCVAEDFDEPVFNSGYEAVRRPI